MPFYFLSHTKVPPFLSFWGRFCLGHFILLLHILNRIAINRLEFFEDGKVAFTYITKEDEESVNAESGDHEGIVETGRDIEGVEVSIFVRETDKGCKVSMRSNEYVNVSDVCLLLGGGGHIRAAGATMQYTIEQKKKKILRQIKSVI